MSFNLTQTITDLTDLVAERDGLVAQVASLTTDLAEADDTIADQLAIIASLNTLVDTLEAQLDVLTRVVIALDIPEGTDSGAILYTLPAGSWTVTGVGLEMDGQDVILADKVVFFEQTSPTCTIDGPSKYRLNWTVVPGYYDVGLLNDNLAFWWDMADNRQYSTDEGDTYLEIVKDKSPFARHMRNPWYADRRPRLASPSALKSGLNAIRNESYATGKTFGLACPEAPIWHGMRYIRMFSDRIELNSSTQLDNNVKTTFSGLTSTLSAILNTNVAILIYGDATSCTLRINGAQVAQLMVGAGHNDPPANSFLFAWVGRLSNFNVLFSSSHIGQHPYWESGSFDGDIVEMVQFLNVAVA